MIDLIGIHVKFLICQDLIFREIKIKTFVQSSVFVPFRVILIHIHNCAGKISHRCLCKPASSF